MKSFVTAFFVFASLAMFTHAEAQTLGSCQIFPSNNPWNVRVDTLPVHWNSAAYIAHVGIGTHVHPDFGSDTDYGIPWEAVNGSQPFVSINTSNGYQDQSDPGPMPIPPNAEIEHDDDSHVLVVDTGNHRLYELYQGVKDQNDNNWSATSSAIFALDSNNFRPDGWTSCDAAGLPIFPGLVRLDECKAGVINHALRFTVQTTQKGWIFPARHEASKNSDTTYMPMGLRMRLKASFDDSKYTGYAKVIITALKKYGIILADNGSNMYISGEWNPNWPDDDINQLKNIVDTDFEAVYSGPVRTQPNQYPDPVLPIPTPPSGTGVLHVATNPIDFGQVHVGHADTMTLTISNSGNGPLIVSKIVPLAQNTDFMLLSFTIFSALPDTLQPGANLPAPVQFMPSGVVYDTLAFQLTISGTPGQTSDTVVSLIGEGIPNLSVAATAKPEPFNFYPNPTSGILSISANSIDGPAKIEITDQLGRTVFLQAVQTASETLDLSGLPNGAYFARLIGASGSAAQRIILAR